MSTSQRLLTAFWLAAGINHFVNPRFYEAIMPEWIPAHREMVQWSGVAEIVAGLLVINARTRHPLARWWILGVLAAVYPANVQMAINHEKYSDIPRPMLLLRLPVQFLFAWWAWKATAPGPAGPATGS